MGSTAWTFRCLSARPLTWDVDEAVCKHGDGESRSQTRRDENRGDRGANAGTRSRSAHDEHVKERCKALGHDGSAMEIQI